VEMRVFLGGSSHDPSYLFVTLRPSLAVAANAAVLRGDLTNGRDLSQVASALQFDDYGITG